MKKKHFVTLFFVLVFMAVLAACGGADAEPTPPPAEEPAADAPEDEVVAEPAEEMAEDSAEEPADEPADEPVEEVAEEPAEETEAEAPAVEPVATLTIWADDTRTPILQGLADEFLAEYNVELIVEDLGVVQDIRSQVIIAAPAGEGPDIYLGVHDWLGALVESGLVAPVELGDIEDQFVESTLNAFTYTDGNLYGLPYATENLGFFYNTDLVSEPPATWDEVLEIGRELQGEGLVEYATAVSTGPLYNALPIQTAFGGYIFGQDENGAWNADDVGLDSSGEVAAVAWMTAAVEEGLMPETFDYETAHSLFETGQIPFLMAGPWALDRIRASGVPYAVAESFPDGGAPFLGVQGFMINPFSDNVLLAQAFLTEFVATQDVMQLLYETGLRPSAYKPVLEATDDPDLKAMGLAGANAMPMPNIPEMGSVWSAADNGITLAVTGEQTAEEAMGDAAEQVRALIRGALAGMVNLPGTFQDQAGCGAQWDPACQATGMEAGDDGLYTLVVDLPAGDYEFKVALDGDWTVNYGSDGAQDGPNYTLSLASDSTVTFTYDPESHLVEIATE
ncbi:MAG: extracellular solute-binding protein [Anaerolineales bacterium]|nr:extracellular solute-binding protein [Anaerolineales bacterium]